MTATAALLEPSFVELIAAIGQAAELSEQTRRHWVCSARRIARWLDRPAAVIPARLNAVAMPVRQLHHARLGCTAKTLANHRSNIRAALRWIAKQYDIPRHGMRLPAEWEAFRNRIDDRRMAARLSSLMRYCAARGIGPASVNDKVFDEYWRYRAEITSLESNNSVRRRMARMWNACAGAIDGGPLQRLTEPPIKANAGPAWEDFPGGLRGDVDAYLGRLTKPRRGLSGKRIRPCQPATIRTRRAQLVAVARMAIRLGVPIESLSSLAALLHPDVVEPVIEAYWRKDGDEPRVYTIDLGWRLLMIAREMGGLDKAAIDRLDEIRATLEDSGDRD